MAVLAASLVASRDTRIKYLIFDRRILSGAAGPSAWTWRPYTGPNPHTHHLHVSVVASPACDDTRPWALPAPTEEDVMTQDQENWLRDAKNHAEHADRVVSANAQATRDAVSRVETAVSGVRSALVELTAAVHELPAQLAAAIATPPAAG